MTSVNLTEAYEVKIWKDSPNATDGNFVRYWTSNGDHVVANLAEMRSYFAQGSANYHYFEHWRLQFGADGKVYVYDGDGPYSLKETGTWTEKTINGQTAMMLHLSALVRLRGDIEGIPFFIEWEDGTVKQGEYYPAGNVDYNMDEYEFNQTAFDALMGNLVIGEPAGGDNPPAVSGYEIRLGYLQYRNLEAGAVPYGWVDIFRDGAPITAAEISQVILKDASGNLVNLESAPWFTDEVFYDCRTGTCLETLYQNSGFTLKNFQAEPAVGTYVMEVTTTGGVKLSQEVDYRGAILLPIVKSSNMSGKKIAGGFEFTWQNPTTEPNWDLVEELRLDLSDDYSGEKRVMVRLSPTAENFFLPDEIILQAGLNPQSTSLRWFMQTRAYESGDNYARGISDKRRIDGIYWPLGEVLSEVDTQDLPVGFEAIDFQSVGVAVDAAGFKITYSFKEDFVNAQLGNGDYLTLGMWADFDGTDEISAGDLVLAIRQDLTGGFGVYEGESCGTLTASSLGNNVIQVSLTWDQVKACGPGLSPTTEVRFWSHYSRSDGFGITNLYPNYYY